MTMAENGSGVGFFAGFLTETLQKFSEKIDFRFGLS